MFTSVVRQNPVEPILKTVVLLLGRDSPILLSDRSIVVDPEGFEPSSEQRTSHTLRFLVQGWITSNFNRVYVIFCLPSLRIAEHLGDQPKHSI